MPLRILPRGSWCTGRTLDHTFDYILLYTSTSTSTGEFASIPIGLALLLTYPTATG